MHSQLPILIFEGDKNLCYGILNSFSKQLKEAFVSLGEEVVFFDPQRDDITKCFDKKYKAIIGFMETFFYNMLPNSDIKVFDLISGPKFNFIPDHPAYYYQFVDRFPEDYYILTLDRNYVEFINKYYKNVKAFFLPPGGIRSDNITDFDKRKYDVSFLGTYVDYREALKGFNDKDETTKLITNTYLDYMIQNPDSTTENSFAAVLDMLGAEVNTEQFLSELMKIHRIATMGAARYYKEKIVETIVESGIILDVFGKSWEKAPFAQRKNLRIHEELPASMAYKVYLDSKISLNIMTWHKDSLTERVLDAMFAGSIALTNVTPVMSECFDDKKDILFFSYDNIKMLSDIINQNLNNKDLAFSGYQKALKLHTWEKRAEELLLLLENIV